MTAVRQNETTLTLNELQMRLIQHALSRYTEALITFARESPEFDDAQSRAYTLHAKQTANLFFDTREYKAASDLPLDEPHVHFAC